MTDYTLSADTYWSGSTSVGTGDGSSFDNRKMVPSDMDNLTISPGSATVNATLYLVREVLNADLQYAKGATSNDFNAYGPVRTITDASHNDSPEVTFTWTIGGEDGGNDGDRIRFWNEACLSYCNIGNDGAGTELINWIDIYTPNQSGFPWRDGVFYKCFVGSPIASGRSALYGNAAFIDCNLEGTGQKTLGISPSVLYEKIDSNSTNSSTKRTMYNPQGWSCNIFDAGGHAFQSPLVTATGGATILSQVYKANLTAVDSSANAIQDIQVTAYSRNGTAAGMTYYTNASGITIADDAPGFNQYRRGSIYVATSRYRNFDRLAGTGLGPAWTSTTEERLSDSTFMTTFVFFDPAAVYTTTTLSTVITGDLVANVEMATSAAASSITISAVATRPDPPVFNKDFAIDLTTSSAAALSAIQIVDATTGKIQATKAAVNSSTSASALFIAGTCATGTEYTIKGLIASDGGELGDIDTDSSFSVTDTFEPNLMVSLLSLFDTSLGSGHAEARLTTQEFDDQLELPAIVLVRGRTSVPSQYFGDVARRAETRVFIDTYVSNLGGRMTSYQSTLTSIKAKLEALDQETRRLVMANKDDPLSHIQRIEYIGETKNPTIFATHKQRIFSTRHELKVTWWSTNV